MLNSKQRAYLRKLSQTTDAIFQVGKGGVTPELVEAIREAINTRELIKLTVLQNCMEDIKVVSQMIAERTRSEVVYTIGRKIVLYKQASKEEDRKISF